MKKYRGIFIKNAAEIEIMREANKIVSRVLDAIEASVEPGVTTMFFEEIAQKMCKEYNVKPAFQGYGGFPCAVCSSVNEEVVHGIPSDKPLNEGDIVSIDMGVIYNGFYGDSARTFTVGQVSDNASSLVDVTRQSLMLGLEQARPGNYLHDIARAVQQYVEGEGYNVVRRFVGHGIGRKLHEKPEVPNFVSPNASAVPLKAGMVLAIEPMVTIGSYEVKVLDDQWTVVTKDGSLSAHFEHTVAITDDGPRILSLS